MEAIIAHGIRQDEAVRLPCPLCQSPHLFSKDSLKKHIEAFHHARCGDIRPHVN